MGIIYSIIGVVVIAGIIFAVVASMGLAYKINEGDSNIAKIILKVIVGLVLFSALAGMIKGCNNNGGLGDIEDIKRLN